MQAIRNMLEFVNDQRIRFIQSELKLDQSTKLAPSFLACFGFTIPASQLADWNRLPMFSNRVIYSMFRMNLLAWWVSGTRLRVNRIEPAKVGTEWINLSLFCLIIHSIPPLIQKRETRNQSNWTPFPRQQQPRDRKVTLNLETTPFQTINEQRWPAMDPPWLWTTDRPSGNERKRKGTTESIEVVTQM